MGQVIRLQDRRARRAAVDRSASPAATRVALQTTFHFDLACPFSYLAAERIERLLGEVEWVPAPSPTPRRHPPKLRAEAEMRARELRLPLSWPDCSEAGVPGALRAAAWASEQGAGARFGLAALRLAFCGGYDLQDPRVLAEAAAAAGLDVEGCLFAADDPELDWAPEAAAAYLSACGVRELPAVRVGVRWYSGERGLDAAAFSPHAA